MRENGLYTLGTYSTTTHLLITKTKQNKTNELWHQHDTLGKTGCSNDLGITVELSIKTRD